MPIRPSYIFFFFIMNLLYTEIWLGGKMFLYSYKKMELGGLHLAADA